MDDLLSSICHSFMNEVYRIYICTKASDRKEKMKTKPGIFFFHIGLADVIEKAREEQKWANVIELSFWRIVKRRALPFLEQVIRESA